MELFKAGKLKASYAKLDEALALVPLKTRVGGLASLQKAIVMDSLGYYDQAKQVNMSLNFN